MGIGARPLWLLASDIHFKPFDLDRVVRAANWITSIPDTYNVCRAIICGDLLTARTSQPTHVLSECYRFLNKLVEAVPHVNIILGNHDLAYRHDYTTSALEALAISRLAPFVTLHAEVGCHEWDGRRVFVMPFREDQGQIVRAIQELDPKSAAATVGLGHLAINRAITQKHVVNPETGEAGLPSRYPGLTGVRYFAPLARTFTGHFHNHQLILQSPEQPSSLRGSITYIGAPLQLTWGDLFDTQKGVILLDPETLEDALVTNPYAEGYVAVAGQDVLTGQVPAEQVNDKHVMITGRLSGYKYISAKERLVKLGVRSVRDWKPFEPEWKLEPRGLGKTMLPVDIQTQPDGNRETVRPVDITEHPAVALPSSVAAKIERESVDLGTVVQEYVSSLELGSILESRREILTLVGKRLVDVGSSAHDKTSCTIKYKDMLDPSTPLVSIHANDALHEAAAQNIFASHPTSVEITNFLGVQGTLRLDFGHHFRPGMNFIVGHNGAGKSTIIEAIVWCQFGQCLRDGLGVNDVVNDVVKKDCNVRLTFSNGYTISRSRNHSKLRNQTIVEKDGIIQSQFQGHNTKSTQASINMLLGVDFDTFSRTVLLGNESTRSFLSASPLQKRQLIEATLGLGILDGCAEACNSMTNQVDEELVDKQSRLKEITHTIVHLKSRVKKMRQKLGRLNDGLTSLARDLQQKEKNHIASLTDRGSKIRQRQKDLETEQALPDLEPKLLALQNEVSQAQGKVGEQSALATLAHIRLSIDREGTNIKQEIKATSTRLHYLDEQLERLLRDNNTLEIPPSTTKEEKEEDQSRDASSWRGFLLKTIHIFQSVWISILNIINYRAKKEFDRAVAEAKRRWDEYIGAIAVLNNHVVETQKKVAGMENRIGSFLRDIAHRNFASENDARTALKSLTVQRASNVPSQVTAAIGELQTLTNRYNRLQRECESRRQRLLRKQHDLEEEEKSLDVERMNWEASLDRYHLMITSNEKEISTCRWHVELDAEPLKSLSHQAAVLNQEVESIHSRREIFTFWQSAFTRRQVTASKATFRRYVMQRHLGELNKLLGQILTVMYQDAHSMATSTIGALFKGDGEYDKELDNTKPEPASVLDPSLSIDPALEYAKKSSGERKRVDLALFFALFMMGQARSAHVARYMLIDEVFDSLDASGQASVLKWCRWMTERLEYVFVITHSQALIKLAEEGSGAEGDGAIVLTMKAGIKGTELVIDS
ncbi:P-loop containing nucleoside triphosphate hydrolase protein [Durotheca rogersii]|uniref:P-loop containing nucleoside triphosphate hydrolase protein n=1 Tax=Durotheca rogersii TaxID=419775 RepID=UPI00221F4078|nr:P-loop containing nucleoside triphosphate hydrolase protein [Durotheca rogersii]KAI5860341.1 P-loop containing nucleoside triphosphate hydrolase protein [Durotheca rogersii]